MKDMGTQRSIANYYCDIGLFFIPLWRIFFLKLVN
jgi:hypothetical protein